MHKAICLYLSNEKVTSNVNKGVKREFNTCNSERLDR
jgi:hypothetical protein